MISGHQDFNSLYASNDTEQQSFTVNTLGAPNNSTTVVSLQRNFKSDICNKINDIDKINNQINKFDKIS